MTDRLAIGYEPRFDIDYPFGHQGELFVDRIIDALGRDRIEVKHDAQFEKTGNIYVEFRCRRHNGWALSGIATSEAEFWAFVLHEGHSAVFIKTETLKHAARKLWRKGSSALARCDKGSHPTEGVKIPVAWLLQQGTRAPIEEGVT